MSVYEKSLKAFIDVIESGLISTEDWADLNQLASNLPEDAEEISAEIQKWLEPEFRSQIREAYKKQRKALKFSSTIDLDKNLGIANSQSPTKPDQPNQSSRELLINTIQKNSPLSNSPPTKP